MACTAAIRTDRLRLVPFSASHFTERYVSWLNDPEATRFSEQRHRRHDLAECRAYAQFVAAQGSYFWAIELAATNRHIGNITATVDHPNKVADIAILIGEKDCWNSGYGTEAFVGACRFLLGTAGMRKVTTGTAADNVGMLEVMRKAGMVEEGRRMGQFLRDGRPVDLVYGAVFADSTSSRHAPVPS